MLKRSRLLAGLAGVVLLVGAVVVLRVPESSPEEDERVVVERFAAELVVLPASGPPPPQPSQIVVQPFETGLRVSWADGLPGAADMPDVVGYDVRWERVDEEGAAGSRLVVAPDMWLDGLAEGERYRIQVRSVDAYGQRSAPTEATGELEPAVRPLGVVEVYDDFADPVTVAPGSASSRWHVSSPDCAGVSGALGLELDLSCGSGMTVLRARAPLRLSPGTRGELGRVAVMTDAAGPGGELTIDLVPGRADRVGVNVLRASRAEDRDPGLPGGTIRVSVSDGSTQVSVAPDVPVTARTAEYQPAPRRGPGVPHLFEVALTTSGVRVYQDGLAVALRAGSWRRR